MMAAVSLQTFVPNVVLLTLLTGGLIWSPPPVSAVPAAQNAMLDLRASNDRGVYLKLTRVVVADDHIAVDLEATNGSDWPISLNDMTGEMRPVMILKDDLGHIYYLVPPSDNTTVDIPEAATLKQQFVFEGQLDPRATSLTLLTNSTHDPNNTWMSDPVLEISNIPIPR